MAIKKILVQREKRQFIEDLEREFKLIKQKLYYVEDIDKDFHTKYGIIKKADLKKKDGTLIKTDRDKEFIIFSASFIDNYKNIKRAPQIIPLKDIGLIIAQTGINKESKVVDSGTGSGATACFLANIAKEVISYEIKDEFAGIAKHNIKELGLKNVTIKNKDFYTECEDTDADLVTLDLPEPWKAIDSAAKAAKIGGFIASYSPTIIQTADFVNEVRKRENLVHVKTIEIIKRDWEVEQRKVRPKTAAIGHSGYLSFVRRIQ